MTCSTVGAGFNGFFILAIGKNIDLLDEVEPDGGVCDGEDAQGDPIAYLIFHALIMNQFEGIFKKKRPLGAGTSAMNDHTNRRMYTERAPRGINIYAMNDLNTTQEMSKKEKQRLANRLCYQRYKEKRKKASLDHYYNNKEKCLDTVRRYRTKNKDRHLAAVRSYWLKNKEVYNERSKKWFLNNKQDVRIKCRERYKTDPQFRLGLKLRNRVRDALKTQGKTKNKTTVSLLGCTILQFKQYLESMFLEGMTWENYTLKGWHVDHIRPCNTFDLSDPEQQKICFHYTNLRPLWSRDNLSRPKDGSDIKE